MGAALFFTPFSLMPQYADRYRSSSQKRCHGMSGRICAMLLLQNKFSYMKTGLENVLKNRIYVRLVRSVPIQSN